RFNVDAANLGIIESFLFPPPPRSLTASLDTRPRFTPAGVSHPKTNHTASKRVSMQSVSANRRAIVVAPAVKLIIGFFAVLYTIGTAYQMVAALVTYPLYSPMVIGLITGTAIGLLVSILCFRKKSEEVPT
ncbi:MAG TPA: hypothetical protein VG711_07065, partial [Phycisphaerales bacterium]|nr:hypothetical protein [Phycisphaerales bacterium]